MKSPSAYLIKCLVSGGQTGVDRAALDVARAAGIRHGGWCPRGRIAEDGRIPLGYELQETNSSDYAVRTELNVVDSDGTLILFEGRLQGGTLLTRRLAKRHGKPILVVDLGAAPEPQQVQTWICESRIAVLNVAGPRESSVPGIYERAFAFLDRVLNTRGA